VATNAASVKRADPGGPVGNTEKTDGGRVACDEEEVNCGSGAPRSVCSDAPRFVGSDALMSTGDAAGDAEISGDAP
jgi:hypothetical protein